MEDYYQSYLGLIKVLKLTDAEMAKLDFSTGIAGAVD
jgi:hypothetical protein